MDAVERAVAGQGRVEARHSSRVAVAVGGRHLGGAPLPRVDHARPGDIGRVAIGVEAHQRQARQRRRIRAEPSPELFVFGRGLPRHQLGAAFVELGADADEEVDARGLGDGLAQVGAERLAGDAAHDLADQESLRVDVVAVAFSGLPPWRLRRERLRHHVPAAPRAGRQRARNRRQRRLMREQVAQRDPRLARLRELRPVSGDGRVELEPPHLGESEHADGGDRLADGVEVDDRVALPRARARAVGVSAPQVDHAAPVDVDRERGADLGAGGEDLAQRVADSLESARAAPVNGQRGSLAFSSASCSRRNARMSSAMSSSLAHCSL